jgi:ABC-type multidrug transport system fused ATPase/permease subunit
MRELKREKKSIRVLFPEFLTKKLKEKKKVENVATDNALKCQVEETSVDILNHGFKKGLNNQNVSMNFKFENLRLALPDQTVILNGVSGSISGGRMVAIMGPSGAGSNFTSYL